MIFKRVNHFVWIIGGLWLALLVWGGLGALQVASSSSVAETALPISMTSARLAQGMFHAPGLPGVEVTPTPSPETRTYAVETGDTLWSIATKFYGNGTKYLLIQQANNLTDNTLRTGQILVIPFTETEKTPTLKAPPPASITPSPAPSILFAPPVISPSVAPSNQPLPTVTPISVPGPVANSSDSGIASFIPILGIVVNVLGTICLLGSIVCAVLSYDIYRRSRHHARRRYIGNRVRAGL
jgi:LysM repeat protein